MANLDNRSEAFRLWERSLAKFVPGVFTPVLVQRRIRTGATGHLVGLTGSYLETGLETISLQMNDHTDRGTEAASMVHRKKSKRSKAKTILRLPDLEQSKNAVLHSLAAPSSQESYGHAIDEFVDWYCSEPRLALNRTVVLRYRSYLEARLLAPGTINLRLGAVRRLACEAADSGLLSSDLAAGIRRIKGVRNLGVRLGNWLTVEQSLALWRAPDGEKLKSKRDRALLALLLACGLRRHEAVGLRIEHLEQREER